MAIYPPDCKYATDQAGATYPAVRDHPQVAAAALPEVYRQVGPLVVTEQGVAQRGVLVRHLVLPHDPVQSRAVIDPAAQAAPGCTINVTGRYRPCHRARELAELLDYPSAATLRALRDYAHPCGLLPEGV